MKQTLIVKYAFNISLYLWAITMILGCSPKSSSQAVQPKVQDVPKNSLSTQDPYSANLEWAAYRESIGMYALHLKPSLDLMDKQYEIKEESFLNGKKVGELIFNADKLGYIRDAIYDDSCLHFYAFRNADSLFSFKYSPKKFQNFLIDLSLEKENSSLYKWVALYEDTKKMFELKDSSWKPIFALTLPYKELCTPDECFYCVLPENVYHYQDWGTTMKIKHYYIFSIRVL